MRGRGRWACGVVVAVVLLALVPALGGAAGGGARRAGPVVTSGSQAVARRLDPRLREKAAARSAEQVPVLVVLDAGTKTPPAYLEGPLRIALRADPSARYYAGTARADRLAKLATARGVAAVLDNGSRTPPRPPEEARRTPEQAKSAAKAAAARVRAAARAGAARRFAASFDERGVPLRTPAAPARTPGSGGGEPTGWFDVGADHSSAAAWADGHTGAGVKVAVIDSGVDFAHPDLASTYATVPAGSPYAGWPLAFDPFSLWSYATYARTGGQALHTGASWFSMTTATVSPDATGYASFGGHWYRLPGDSVSGTYHIGVLNDDNLERYWYGEKVAVIVSDATTSGVYETVRVDLDDDYDFTGDKPVTKDSPLSYADTWDSVAGAAGSDGYADVSGGMVYFIADGTNHPPGFTLAYPDLADVPPPGAGGLVAFMGSLDDSVNGGMEHGTMCASAVSGQGVIGGRSDLNEYPSFRAPDTPGVVRGGGRDAKIAAVGDVYSFFGAGTLQAYDFAAFGLDGVAGSGDEVQIASGSFGASATDNDEWDYASRYVTSLNAGPAPSLTFLFSAGNGGPGYGTKVAPAPSSAISVGASTQFGAGGGFDSIVGTDQVTFGDVISFSGRGPTAMGHLAPHVVAAGAFAPGDVPLNSYGDGWRSWENWGGTSRATPVAAGNLSLVYQAFRDAEGRWPTSAEARTLLMSGADDTGNDPLVQGAGKVDAQRSAALAADTGALWLWAEAWYPGDVRGVRASAFARGLAPGTSDTTSVPLSNRGGGAIAGTATATVYRRTQTVTMSVSIDPTKESAYSAARPDWLTRIDSIVPSGTELMVVRMAFPLSSMDPSSTFALPVMSSRINVLRLLAYDWKDVDSDGALWTDADANGFVNPGEIDAGEYERFTYGYGYGTSTEIRVHDPLGRMHDGVFLGLQHRLKQSGGTAPIPVTLELSFWKRAPWEWAGGPATFSLPAHATGELPLSVSVPDTASPGVYEAQVDLEWGTSAEESARLPVVLTVAPRTGAFTFGDTGTAAADEPLMPNGRVFGQQDWSWRPEAGDWRFFAADVPAPPPGSAWLVRTSWETTPTDLDSIVFRPVPGAFADRPDIFGPYDIAQAAASLSTNNGGGIWRFQTTTGGPSEFLVSPVADGLQEIAVHNVLYAGTSIGTTFTGEAGLLSLQPSPMAVTTTRTSGSIPGTISSDLELPGFSAEAYGLSRPKSAEATVPSKGTSETLDLGALSHVGWIDTRVWDERATDIDLYLERWNGAGWVVAAISDGATGVEHIRAVRPVDGAYRVRVYTFGDVATDDRYYLMATAIAGSEISLAGMPATVTPGSERFTLDWARDWPLADRDGTLQGGVVGGPGEAPTVLQIPVTFRYPFLAEPGFTDGAAGLDRRAPVVVRFSKRLAGVPGAGQLAIRRDGVPVTATIETAETSESVVVTLTPARPLRPDTAYGLDVSGVRALDGDALVPPTDFAFRTAPLDVERLGGADRYATAAGIAASTFTTASTVVIATGEQFPDALAAAALSGVYDAPLLLTRRASLPASVTATIARLGATRAIIVGSDRAVSAGVAALIDAAVHAVSPSAETTRIGGATRYDTAALIAAEVKRRGGASDGAAWIVRGDDFPDALAAAPFAYSRRTPVLLTAHGFLASATDAAIRQLGLDRFYVAGSEAAVSAAVYDGLAARSVEQTRVSGPTRYETAAAVAAFGAARGWGGFGYAGLALGTRFPDALGGGVAAGREGGILLLTPARPLGTPARAALAAHADELDRVRVFGGPPAIPDVTVGEIGPSLP